MMRLPLALLLLATALPASAEVYKWVDEKGRTHFGEVVPERYRKSATSLTPAPLNTISGSQLRGPARSEGKAAAETDRPEDAAPAPEAPRDSASACEAEWARYRASQECFQKYRLANGALRSGATEACETVAQPERRCD